MNYVNRTHHNVFIVHRVFTLLPPLLLIGLSASDARPGRPIAVSEGGILASAPQVSGDLIYVPCTIGNRPGTAELPDGIEAQVRQAMENIRAVLAATGADFSHVVSSNVFLADTRLFPAMNAVYRTYFAEDPPTRATVAVDLPVAGALVQISMVAAKPGVERRVITPEGMLRPGLPYSWGILAGKTLFIAGATSRNPETYEPVPGDMAAQTRQVMENIGAVLRAADMGYSDVASCKVFLDDPRQFRAMNEVYASFFPERPPARATIGAGLMNPIFLSEIQCVAVRATDRRVVMAPGVGAGAGAGPGAVRPRSPYSPAIAVDDRLFLAGMLGRGPRGYAPGDVEVQTRQTLENLRATLAAAGMSFANVVEATVFVADIRRHDAVTRILQEVMDTPRVSTTVVGSRLMSADAIVEIMMTAAR